MLSSDSESPLRPNCAVTRLLRIVAAALFCVASVALYGFELDESAERITLKADGQEALVYHKAPVPPPEGLSELYERNGFIHPLKTPKGGVVTGIHAEGHWHHMGLWHAWVQTQHDGRRLDFWNLEKADAGVRFKEMASTWQEEVGAGFEAVQEHFARGLAHDDSETVILRETLRVSASEANGVYLFDYDTDQVNVSSAALELEQFRYGGPIAYRGPSDWTQDNSDYLTSEGRSRSDGHGTRARWVAMFGPTEVGPATVAILSHPTNHDAPQKVRMWDSGPMFFNYVPIQETGYVIEPGERFVSRYRVVIYDGEPNPTQIEMFWAEYASE